MDPIKNENRKKASLIAVVVLGCIFIISCHISKHLETSKKTHLNYVPDKETAIKIAEAVWLPIYGEKIYREKPFKATLENGIWIVGGTLNMNGDTTNITGGTLYIEIQQYDCKVLRVFHTK